MTMDMNQFGWKKVKGPDAMHTQSGTSPSSREATETTGLIPSMYEVFLIQDNQTSMDFITMVLMKFFNKSKEEATYITLEMHKRGQGYCGRFTRDVAETKISLVSDYSQKYNYPLKCIMQKEPCHVIKKP